MSAEVKNDHWNSRIGVVLAVASGAVGLGNFLRFPGQVVNYGGGAFMIPYMISLLVVAIPLACCEWALGRCGGRLGYHSPLGVYYGVSGGKKRWGLVGGLAAAIPIVINTYYIFIEAWCLLYALQYLGGCLNHFGLGFSIMPEIGAGITFTDSESYSSLFGRVVGIGANGSALPLALWIGAICVLANFLLIYCGISKGVERFSKFAAPLIVVCSLCVLARIITLDSSNMESGRTFLDGLGFMWNPTREIVDASGQVVGRTTIWSTLSNPETWLAATSQIFYTASICLCSTCAYASYVKSKEDIALSSLTSTAANEFCEVALAGLMIVPPAIMFLGAGAASSLGSSFAVGFVALPNVFGLMPGGQLCGFLFFILLFFSAITSSASLAQPTVSLFKEALGLSREWSAIIGCAFTFSGAAVVCWFTKDLAALDSFDFWLSNFGPFLFAVCQTLFVAWIWGAQSVRDELNRGALIRLPKIMFSIVKWVSFPYLTLVFLFWCYTNLGDRLGALLNDRVAQLSVACILSLLLALFIISFFAMRRWKKLDARRETASGSEMEKRD